MTNEKKLILPETWTEPERDLMVQICRYHAQVLYSVRNGFDLDEVYAVVKLPPDGVVPSGAVLLDGHLRAYQTASRTLITSGLAIQPEAYTHACKLLTSSDNFELSREPNLPLSNLPLLERALLAIFRIYSQNGRLGHPKNLGQIFELLLESGFTEKRLGFLEWSTRAIDMAYPRRMGDCFNLRDGSLWITDTFESYIDEARDQWS